MPEISVIIPTYNRPSQLRKAILSVLGQTYNDFEILVVNDHPVETPIVNLIKSFNDNRIKYHSNMRKKGGNGARNTGIIHATGKYLSLLDDDDEYLINNLYSCFHYLEKSPEVDVVITGFNDLIGKKYKNVYNKSETTLSNFLIRKVRFGSNLFFRKAVIKKVGLMNEDLVRHQDSEFMIRLLSFCKVNSIKTITFKQKGHNPPSASKSEKYKKIYINKISKYLFNISPIIKREFFALEYRELALFYTREKKYTKAYNYLKMSVTYKILTPNYYLRIIIELIKNMSIYSKCTLLTNDHSNSKIK